jgi:diguanylate cyclase (GGDEF)-like protein
MDMLKKFWSLVLPKNPKEINDIVDMANMSSIKAMSIFTAIVESLVMMRYLIIYRENLYFNLTTAVNITVVFSCVILATLADLFIQGKIHGHKLSVFIVLMFIIIISFFSMYTSYTNYKVGRQILVLFVANVSIISFLQITPLYHMVLLIFEFILLYSMLYSVDGAKNIVFINAFSYLIVILILCVVSYHRKNDSVIATYEARQRAEDFYIKSSEDQLTGLMNRFALDSIKIKKGLTFCVAMTDIDLFKTYNDKYGHLKGDEVIKMAASNLLEIFRKKDCFRYGGDEFLILTTKMTEVTFKQKMSIWENKVMETGVEGIDTPIRISYGVACGIVYSKEDLMALIKKADDKLYSIKSVRHTSSEDR